VSSCRASADKTLLRGIGDAWPALGALQIWRGT